MGFFLYSAGNKIMKKFQDSGYFDRSETRNVKAKYIPGFELQLTSEHCYNSADSLSFKKEVGILYRLKFGDEIGARVLCKSNPIVHFHATLRNFSKLTGYSLTCSCALDVNKHKFDKLNGGVNFIAGNYSAAMHLVDDKIVCSTRHRIHPRIVTIGEATRPYVTNPLIRPGEATSPTATNPLTRTALALGLLFEVNSGTSLEVMVSNRQPPTFALQFQCPNPQCVVRVSGDVYLRKTGVSIALQPYKA